MSVTTEQYIHLIDSETEALDKTVLTCLLDANYFSWQILIHSWIIYSDSKKLLKDIKKKSSFEMIDDDDIITDTLSRIQNKIKSAYHDIEDSNHHRKKSFLLVTSSWLLKKAFDNYGLVIVHIMEHDIDADRSPNSQLFDSVNDLMKHLDS
jgi:hypothetical protein